MITHYDMTTGEVIGGNVPAETATAETRVEETAQLRLLSVHEATAPEPRTHRPPADAILLPVPVFLARVC